MTPQIPKRRLCLTGFMVSVCFFMTLTQSCLAASVLRDLNQLELLVSHTIERLESGITLDQQPEPDFSRRAGLQFELSALAAGRPDLLEEDYYHLALSLIARHFAEYDLAHRLLQLELAAQKLDTTRHWLIKEISEIEKLQAATKEQTKSLLLPSRDHKMILQDLKKTLAKAGVR